MMVAGGRYACGDVNSVMPVWSNTGHPPGPLNYIQIDDIISFIRAPSNQTYIIRDPSLGEPKVDPLTERGPDLQRLGRRQLQAGSRIDPVPGVLEGRVRDRIGRSVGSAGPAASIDPNATVVDIVASGIKFDPTTLTGPADKAFVIDFDNQDAGVPHNIQIKDSAGAVKFTGATFNGVAKQAYQVPALTAGSYPFQCTVHPTMTGTLTIQ